MLSEFNPVMRPIHWQATDKAVSHSSPPLRETQSDPERIENNTFNRSALVERIWGFITDRIEQEKKQGATDSELASLWESALAGVNTGFSEAKAELSSLDQLTEQLGLDINASLDDLVHRMDDQLEALNNEAHSLESAVSTEATKRSTLQHSSQRFELTLNTLEGDKVHILAINQASKLNHNQDFGRLSSTQWEAQQDYQLYIQGDLNSQELNDINHLLSDVNEVANTFYRGDYDRALMQAQSINIDGSRLMNLNFDLKDTKISAVAQYTDVSGETSVLPKGLQPLKEYAQYLKNAADQWNQHFSNNCIFIETLACHPHTENKLIQFAQELMSK